MKNELFGISEQLNDLISRQAAIDYFVTNVGFRDDGGYPIEDSDELRKIWTNFFDGIPSAQPEIIRCKECKWASEDLGGLDVCQNVLLQIDEEGNGFCSDAERREDE